MPAEVCKVIGRDALADDANWGQMSWRVAHHEQVDQLLTDWTQSRTAHDVVTAISAAGAVASTVQDIDDLMRSPHLKARNMIDSLRHPALGVMPGVHAAGFPLKFSATETGYGAAAVPSGTHNKEVYGELLGLCEKEIEALQSRSIV